MTPDGPATSIGYENTLEEKAQQVATANAHRLSFFAHDNAITSSSSLGVSAADLERWAKERMNAPLAASSTHKGKVWALWLSIAVQQVVFLLAFGLRIPLLEISTWVIYVPIVIIWTLYIVVPPLKRVKGNPHALLRSYALIGWIFVAAAISWTASYLILSRAFGTPVSHERMQELYRR